MPKFHRPTALAAAALTVPLLVLAGCGADGEGSTAGGTAAPSTEAASTEAITLYNAQHDFVIDIAEAFTAKTGIEVKVRSGDDFEMANQIVAEGDASPADVFVTENSPAMSLVASNDAFVPIDDATRAQVPDDYEPDSGDWVGFAARATVLAYNSGALKTGDLPASVLDLADPAWKGKVGISPAGADFQAIVSAVVAVEGKAAAAEWLTGLKANAKVYDGNSAVMEAVNAGDVQAGIIYHYYWYQDRAESGANSADTELHYFGGGDPGAFVSVSGAGVLKSDNEAAAQDFVAFLTSVEGQQIMVDSGAREYAVAEGTTNTPDLRPLSELDPPAVDPGSLNGPEVVELMQQAGLL